MTQFLQNAVYGTVMIVAVALLRRVLKDRLAPGARLALWAVCLFRLLTPVAPSSVLSLWGLFRQAAPVPEPAAAPSGTGMYLPAPDVNAPAMMAPDTAASSAVEAGIPWKMVLLGVWLAVGAALAARYALSYVRTRRAVGETVPLGRDDPRYQALPRCARLREGPMEGAPLTFGVVRPTVVLTPGLSGEVLECVLAHEGVHARRRDNLWHYVTAAALTVFWWNPAVWIMSRLLRRDVELSCDRAALERLGPERRAEYANALVSMATQADGPAFCQTFGRKAAEERILSVMKYKKMTVAGAALSLALVLAVSVGFASNPAEDTPDEDSTTSSAPADLLWSTGSNIEDGSLTNFTIDLSFLEKNLAKHVADGSMTQEEADRVMEQARALSKDDKALVWSFQGDSGHDLFTSGDLIFYKNESGELVPVDPATVVSGFILNRGGTVTYHGRTYNRADLSQETLDWLDWYLALPEAEQLAISMVPPELISNKDLPTYVEPGQTEEPAGTVGSEFYDYRFETPDGAVEPAPAVTPTADNLVPAIGTKGEDGYIRESDVPGANVKNPEEALAHMAWLETQPSKILIPLYDAKGNVIGQFAVSNSMSQSGYTQPMTFCDVEGCTISGEHFHHDVKTEDSAPLGTAGTNYPFGPHTCADCGVEGCTVDYLHQHSGEYTFKMGPVCTVDGCTTTGSHIHDGTGYSCNGAGHHDGVCDGSCYTSTSLPQYVEPVGCPPEAIDQSFTEAVKSSSQYSGTHHSESHSSSHHSSGHH